MTEQLAAPSSLRFASADGTCAGWHLRARTDALTGPAGRPLVVMAHGLGGTVDAGLLPFATGLAEAGLDVLAFDYRGFGASPGEARQRVSVAGQLADYRAAMVAGAQLEGVDPRRLVLWGVSLSGGHVLSAAADRDDVAAVISLTPLVDGIAAGRHALGVTRPTQLLRSSVDGVRSRVNAALGRPPVTMPIVGRPGERAALTVPGSYERYTELAGPTWRNELDAAVTLELGGHRPGRDADRVRCPLLVQIGDLDRSAPPHAAAKAAFRGGAEVRRYPCDHFDVWPGGDWFDPVVTHQVAFLRRHLQPADS